MRFLVDAGFLTSAQGRVLLNDLRRNDEDQFLEDIADLVDADVLRPEVGQLLVELGR